MSKNVNKTEETNEPKILPDLTQQPQETSETAPHEAWVNEVSDKKEPETNQRLNELMTEHKTKSGVIRHLHGEGWTRGAIAKFMGLRYQHVRNVILMGPPKRA
jgi:DMSO/TMAO reductase YedYZ molybdopterin-dependent catalytic subunit